MDNVQEELKRLQDPDTGSSARLRLHWLGEEGADLTSAKKALRAALKDATTHLGRSYSAQALAHAYIQEGEWNEVREMLASGDNAVRDGAGWALYNKALKGLDILPVLGALFPFFMDTDANIRKIAIHSVDALALKCGSLEGLDQTEKQLQVSWEGWQRKQPTGVTPEKIAMQTLVATWQMKIAERKAELARRNDGELLAGETIVYPVRGRSAYSTSSQRRV